jgi:dihydropteroate synthase
MGIINLTPDSFSDGSQLGKDNSNKFEVDVDKALGRARALVAEGAGIVDVGGESTRPGADAVSTAEELGRVIPVIEAIRADLDVCISVDSSCPRVMLEAIKAGAEVINDIRALANPQALDVISRTGAAVCLMHMQGEPRTMQAAVSYEDVTEEVFNFLRARVQLCLASGIERNHLIIDPGLGFGKSLQHNYRLLKDLPRLQELELPILVGISRKSMIGAVTDRPVDARLAGSVAATVHALRGGANIVRTHDVAATVDAIRVNSAFFDA